VLPLAPGDGKLKAAAEQIEDRILLALAKAPSFQVVERRDAQSLLDELRRSGSDLFDSDQSAKVGKMLGARLALISKLTPKQDRLEVFMKLVRVETGEVLSMAMLKLDPALLK
jgi:curli biogenesis system outer membrane secretion channel CsgG